MIDVCTIYSGFVELEYIDRIGTIVSTFDLISNFFIISVSIQRLLNLEPFSCFFLFSTSSTYPSC
jgi:hypothetical protein